MIILENLLNTLATSTACSYSSKMLKIKPKIVVKIDDTSNNKKVYYGDEGQVVDEPVVKPKPVKKLNNVAVEEQPSTEENVQKLKKGFKKKYQQNGNDLETKWYQVYQEHNTSEFKDIKDSELKALQSLCKNAFNEEVQKLMKSKLKTE